MGIGSLSAQKMEMIDVVKNIFKSTDALEWQKVQQSFAQRVMLDYTSMAGGEPVELTPQEITDSWKNILPGFDKTRHMVAHFEVKEIGEKGFVSHYGTATHYLNGSSWTVIGNYDYQLIKEGGLWKVSAMTFNLEFVDGNTGLPRLAKERLENGSMKTNKELVDQFFVALETQQFHFLKEVFAEDAKQLNPYIPEGFPKSFDGREAIYQQYNGLTANFGQMRFPREIFSTEDPNTIFVKFRGEIEIKAGGKYVNDYFGIFRIKDGQVVEYQEYFNPIVMAKAFNIDLK